MQPLRDFTSETEVPRSSGPKMQMDVGWFIDGPPMSTPPSEQFSAFSRFFASVRCLPTIQGMVMLVDPIVDCSPGRPVYVWLFVEPNCWPKIHHFQLEEFHKACMQSQYVWYTHSTDCWNMLKFALLLVTSPIYDNWLAQSPMKVPNRTTQSTARLRIDVISASKRLAGDLSDTHDAQNVRDRHLLVFPAITVFCCSSFRHRATKTHFL